jgi:hypothetical protein
MILGWMASAVQAAHATAVSESIGFYLHRNFLALLGWSPGEDKEIFPWRR